MTLMRLRSVCLSALFVPLALITTPSASRADAASGQAFTPSWSQAVSVTLTRAVRDLVEVPLTGEALEKRQASEEAREKNEENTRRVKPPQDLTKVGPFVDPALNNFKYGANGPDVVTNPIQNFDTLDMDEVSVLVGGRFAPPDTNAAVGPNHVVMTTNGAVRIFDKAGIPLTAAFRLSTLLVGIPNATDDDGDPIALYDALADRWILSQFNLALTANSTHQHVAVSTTSDPTGTYFAYDFLMVANRPGDYPHMGVWPDAYYMSTNDFSLPVFSNPFQGAGLYAFERDKMLVGDPTATIVAFSTTNVHGGMLPANFQGVTPPPVGTPNLFFEFDADEFGAPFDLVRPFIYHVDFAFPASSTLVQGPDIPTAAFDARQPASRANVAQPAPGEGLDSIADRLMHALNFRVLPGGVQSYVLNFSVNVSGVNPTSSATYQTGVRWMELRRDPGTGVVSINQQATYAPGSGNPTGRDLWMASLGQDGEGNIALAASASNSTAPLLNPTAIYTGRLAGDPANTLPQGEIDALVAVTRGVQTATQNRWGDYSSLFIDPADDCTFWGAFEYVDSPTATFDWNTRVFSFRVNPTCVTPPRGILAGTITDCSSGLPILGAQVTATGGYLRTTNAAGNYGMDPIAPGSYTVTATKANYSTVTQSGVSIVAGNTTTLNMCLVGAPVIVSAGATLVSESCSPGNGAIDPNETVTTSLCLQNTGTFNSTNLVGTLQATGGVTSPSGPQNYGVVVASGPPVCRNFTFTAAGTCGGSITASLQLQDGAVNLGTLTYIFTLGVESVLLSENFDGVVAPALPAGWTASFTNGDGDCTVGGPLCTLGTNFTTVTTSSDTAPNSAFHNDPSCVTDNLLVSPTFAVASAAAQVTFRHDRNLESTFDGGVLEISLNGGAFTDVILAGGSFVTNGYNATIAATFLSPIAGRQAWSGTSAGYVTTTVNLPAAAAGQNVQLRYRMASDCSVSAVGWNIDTLRITDGFTCCQGGGGCVITCPADATNPNDPGLCGAVQNYPAPTTSGNCGTVTCSPASGSFFVVGPTAVTCTSSTGPSCTFTETVTDAEAPVVTMPSQSAGTDPGLCSAVVTFNPAPSVTDNCAGASAPTCVPPSGSTFVLGPTVVTCNATDAAGNPGSGQGTVTVFDDEDPTISCPADFTGNVPPGDTGATANYPPPTSADNCSGVTDACSPPSGSFFLVGTTPVSCTATDGAGNTASCAFNVIMTQFSIIEIPALSMLGLGALVFLLLGLGLVLLRRRA